MYRTFESIKNCQRCYFLKIFVIPGGNATPHKFQRGDTSAPLPNRSGMYQGTTPTTWLNFNTPCKSQLKNAWPFSPTTTVCIHGGCAHQTGGQTLPLANYCSCVERKLVVVFDRCMALVRKRVGMDTGQHSVRSQTVRAGSAWCNFLVVH